jgi:hypothetical protein
LSRFSLVQSLNEYFMFCYDSDACFFKRSASCVTVTEKKVSYAKAIDYEGASTFDTYARASQGVAHFSQGAGAIFKLDR